MPARVSTEKNLVVRPDRVDFRDRAYQPPLRSLPEQHPPPHLIKDYLKAYVKDGNILDQGKEGACTGFGLAACINYIYWARWVAAKRRRANQKQIEDSSRDFPKPPRVSPHMLYRNARVYDEWEGTDYEGSSCRGAMKGWFKHGVCDEKIWPSFGARPAAEWPHDAALRPLGAYYRVDAKSIADMQAAIFEVQAVYCSADVHAGWERPEAPTDVGGEKLVVIEPRKKIDGGHAFALVGYTRDGFIVQNSWKTDWGSNGFALLTYEDWAKNGYDAWVAALGAPTQIGIAVGSPSAMGRAGMMTTVIGPAAAARAAAKAAEIPPWSESRAYEHSVVMGNDGKLLDRIVGATGAGDFLAIVTEEKVAELKCDRIAVYVHGGLNSEDAAIARARRLGPWFLENGIHPIFVVWRTGILEAIGQIGLDEVKKYEEQVKSIRARGLGDIVDAVLDVAREAFDRAFEVTAEKFIGKAVWSQMKQNAMMACTGNNGAVQVLTNLAKSGKPLHLLGHSAGSIMIGHMLDVAAATDKDFASCGLYAPACTLGFAVDHYGRSLKAGGALNKAPLHIDILTDEAETDDLVGPYGKSLLYLVSRALEDMHKTPLLGLDIALKASGKGKMELNKALHANAYGAWKNVVAGNGRVSVERHRGPKVKVSPKEVVPIAHGSFDNDLDVVNASLERILGKPPAVEVTDLSGF